MRAHRNRLAAPPAPAASKRHRRVRGNRFPDASPTLPPELVASLQHAAAFAPQLSRAEQACIRIRDARTRAERQAAAVAACAVADDVEAELAREQAAFARLAAGGASEQD